MKNNLFPIAQEGWVYIAYTLAALVIFAILGLEILSILALFLSAFLLFLFRNPERELPRFELNSVVSPVDGEVVAIEELEDSDYRYKIVIKSNYLDVSILRSPIQAKIKSFFYTHGSRLGVNSSLAQSLNENVNMTFEDANKNSLKVVHLAKESFCGIKLEDMKEKSLMQSARYGVMVNGMTYIYLPQNFRLDVTAGSTLTASNSLIGYFY